MIIGGPSSTGKSTLAHKLAADLKVQAFLKDDYKERRFDSFGGRPGLRQLAKIENDSWLEMYKTIAARASSPGTLIVEGNFLPKNGYEIRKLIEPDTTVLEIFCYARGFTILKRYVRRNRSGERHKAHRDHLWYPLVALEAIGIGIHRYRPLELSPNLLKVNADDFTAVDYEAIRRFVTVTGSQTS